MLEQIVRLAEAIVQPSEAEQPLLTALCEAAEAELARRLREGLTPEDCGGVFPCAAALLAAAGLPPCRGGGGGGAVPFPFQHFPAPRRGPPPSFALFF